MPRQSPLENLIYLAIKLPFWISYPIAAIAWLYLHNMAGMEVTPGKDIQEFSENFIENMIIQFAPFLQYIIPGIFVFGGTVSYFKSRPH